MNYNNLMLWHDMLISSLRLTSAKLIYLVGLTVICSVVLERINAG